MPTIAPHSKSSILSSIPLLAIVLIAYNVALQSGYSFANPTPSSVLHLRLLSGAEWTVGWNEALLIGGLLLLFIEIIKSTRTTANNMFEHMFSMVVFIIFVVEFIIVAGAGTTTFLLLGLMSLIDVLGGYTIAIAVARKEMNITG